MMFSFCDGLHLQTFEDFQVMFAITIFCVISGIVRYCCSGHNSLIVTRTLRDRCKARETIWKRDKAFQFQISRMETERLDTGKARSHYGGEIIKNGALFLRLGLPSTLIRHENAALFLRLGLPATLIRHENTALFLRLGLSSTLIRHANAALFLRLGLPSTLIRHENGDFVSVWTQNIWCAFRVKHPFSFSGVP